MERCEKLPSKIACEVQDRVCSKLTRKLLFLGVHGHTEPNFLAQKVLVKEQTLGHKVSLEPR